jgi:transposase
LEQLVFIDEFGAASNLTRLYARGPVGQRIVCRKPHGHWKALSTIAAMSAQGMITGCTFDQAIDTERFLAFVEQCLVPVLRAGQVVVLDNLPAHQASRIDELVESAGAKVLRLPPYSPDFNPIEMAISKLKTLLRKRGLRTVNSLYFGICEAMNAITPENAAAYIRKCGYAAMGE